MYALRNQELHIHAPAVRAAVHTAATVPSNECRTTVSNAALRQAVSRVVLLRVVAASRVAVLLPVEATPAAAVLLRAEVVHADAKHSNISNMRSAGLSCRRLAILFYHLSRTKNNQYEIQHHTFGSGIVVCHYTPGTNSLRCNTLYAWRTQWNSPLCRYGRCNGSIRSGCEHHVHQSRRNSIVSQQYAFHDARLQ